MTFLTAVTAVTTLTNVTTVNKPFFLLLFTFSVFLWKEQFDTFDNECDYLRAAFCDSCYVFLTLPLLLKNRDGCDNNSIKFIFGTWENRRLIFEAI